MIGKKMKVSKIRKNYNHFLSLGEEVIILDICEFKNYYKVRPLTWTTNFQIVNIEDMEEVKK